MSDTLSEQHLQKANLEKSYSPKTVEAKWSVSHYELLGKTEAESAPVLAGAKKPFVVLMPPPNITGSLTMGHVLNHTIQDIFIRYHRMMGYESLWLPGTDHAGIATQTRVEKELKKEKKTKYELGREKFLERVWQWRNDYGDLILKQLRTIGDSADWRRNLFTMDERASRAVTEAFVRLYNDGLIYRGKRMINWCPVSQTALSDEEVVMKTQTDKLYFVRYYLKEDSEKFITVATVRPETMLADVAVAVNPSDERYHPFIGKFVIEPLTKREIPIISDEYVEKDFGTGALKITPAHDPNDYQIGLRHNLPFHSAIDKAGKIEQGFPGFSGLDRFVARKKAEELLTEQGNMEKIEEYSHNVGYSERADVVIEPYLSLQWFVSMKPLAEPALKVVEEGKIRFHPERWVNTYRHWLTNIQDWCISRQLWWGHRIPAWYDENNNIVVASTHEEALQLYKIKFPHSTISSLQQDEDVLDTWFSSWLWPLTTLGWDGKNSLETDDFNAFYPTSTLVTGPDIIFFWVARMIMAGLYFKKEIPFRDVYFTSIIRDGQGRKMSKSLGNSPNPLEVIENYGADALRFTTIYLAPLGQDVRFEVSKEQDTPQVEQGRNFATKIWNAARFLFMNRDDQFESLEAFASIYQSLHLDPTAFSLSEQWIFSRLNQVLKTYHLAYDQFKVNELAKMTYEFLWGDYCDWFIEAMKVSIQNTTEKSEKQEILCRAIFVFEEALKMLHPIMPFITEEIWQIIIPRAEKDSIDTTPIKLGESSWNNQNAEAEFLFIKSLISEIRGIRAMLGVSPVPIAQVQIKASSEAFMDILTRNASLIEKLVRATLSVSLDLPKPTHAASTVVQGNDVYILLEGLIDFEKERQRLTKEIQKMENYIKQLEAKLSNESFVARAPKVLIDGEREKFTNSQDALQKMKENLISIS